MSYNDYLTAVELIEKNKQLLHAIYPQKEQVIQDVENLLKMKFPKSYRDFLKRYGMLLIGAKSVFGLDNIEIYDKYRDENMVCNTLDERKFNYDVPFPLSFVSVYNLGDGEKFCLDTAKMNEEGECPIVGWYFGRIESLKDDVGEDFGDFLLNFVVLPALKSAEEEGKKVVR